MTNSSPLTRGGDEFVGDHKIYNPVDMEILALRKLKVKLSRLKQEFRCVLTKTHIESSSKMNITKHELCNRVSDRINTLSGLELKPILETFIDEILTIMSEDKRIEIRGFGCFKPILRKKRLGRNPRTGEEVDIPAYTAPSFKFSRDAQRIFNDKRNIKKEVQKLKESTSVYKNSEKKDSPAEKKDITVDIFSP